MYRGNVSGPIQPAHNFQCLRTPLKVKGDQPKPSKNDVKIKKDQESLKLVSTTNQEEIQETNYEYYRLVWDWL
jgi:hypothetical protein